MEKKPREKNVCNDYSNLDEALREILLDHNEEFIAFFKKKYGEEKVTVQLIAEHGRDLRCLQCGSIKEKKVFEGVGYFYLCKKGCNKKDIDTIINFLEEKKTKGE